jgi:hypothetical protein
MHEKDENISAMIMDVLQQLNIKPTKHSLNYAKNFIESTGGFQQYYKEYAIKKMAPIANLENDTLESTSISDRLSPINKSNMDERKQTNFSLTPNSLKAPSRPPPKPPAPKRNLLEVKMESTFISSPNSEKNISFISPIVSLNQSDISQATKSTEAPSFSISPPVVVVPPPLQSTQRLAKPLPPPPPPPSQSFAPPLPPSLPSSGSDLNISNSSNFSCSSIDNRSALLKSIENFKGGLKHVNRNTSKSSLGEKTNSNSDNNNNQTNNNNNLFNQLYNALNNMRQYLSKLIQDYGLFLN